MAANSRPRNGVQSRDVQQLSMRAAFAPTSVNEEARTVEVTWSVGADVWRYDYYSERAYVEALSMDPAHVDLSRLNSGAPLLDSHRVYGGVSGVLGVVERASVSGGVGTATVRFSRNNPAADVVFKDVRDGVIRNISVGYFVNKWERTPPTDTTPERRRAIDWQPYELSLVAVGADAGAQVREFEQDDAPRAQEEQNMPTIMQNGAQAPQAGERSAPEAEPAPAPVAAPTSAQGAPAGEDSGARAIAAERRRAADILTLCRTHSVDGAAFVAEGLTLDQVRARILDGIAERTPDVRSPATYGGRERSESMVRSMTDALCARANLAVEGDAGREFRGRSLLRIAESVLEAGGVNTRTLDPHQIASRALATSDFASVLYVVGERLVREGYSGFPMVHRSIFARTTASDFRQRNRLVVAAGETLPEVPESGMIQRGGAKSEIAKYALKSYAKIVPITRKLIIDDDFGFVESVSRQRGRAAAETERKAVWDFVNSNPTAADGVACFDAAHGNFPAASATPIAKGTLNAARSAIRMAQDLDGYPINATLAHIVTTDAGETDWDELVNGVYVPTAKTDALTQRMRAVQTWCEPLVRPAGSAANKKHWYGFTDPSQVQTFEFAYLAGAEGVRVDQRMGFDVEGIELKVCLDFGIGLIDHRGTYCQRES